MFKNKNTKNRTNKKSDICVSFWINEKTLKAYQDKYPRTLSVLIRYYINKALTDEKIVTNALIKSENNVFKKEKSSIKNTIFDEG